MVMQQMRATLYLRRTISESRLSKRLTMSNNSINAISEVDTMVYSWSSDLIAIRSMLFTNLNVLLLFCPLGAMAKYYFWGDIYIFWFNFLALIPLAAMLCNVTEELAMHTGEVVGGLLNATLGNAVEMILTVQSLRAGLLAVVQGALLGSILSNLLLVLGMSFFAGGLYHHVQKFNAQGAACSTSLLMLACMAFITPTIAGADNANADAVLMISRLSALLITGTYFFYLFFQLYTHLSLFKDSNESGETEEEEWPSLSAFAAVVGLSLITLIIAFQSELLVDSIEGVSKESGMPEAFIGVILLPIVGNAAEHVTAVTVAMKNKIDLTMGVAVGSSTQIALFMVPFAVLAGWGMGIPMTLAFSKVAVAVLAFSILIVIGIVQDGESNWLEGVMLIIAYCIVAVAFWFDSGSSITEMAGK